MLYRRLLKDDFDLLPRALREFHSAPGGGRASGVGAVQHSSRWIARLVGFPRAGEGVPIELKVEVHGDREVWVRRFGTQCLRTVQRDRGGLLLESIGPVCIFFRLLAERDGMRFETMRARFWGVPLPLRIYATARGGDTSWEIEVSVPRVGSYRGAMAQIP